MRDRPPIDLAALCWLGLALLWLGYVVEMAAGQEDSGSRAARSGAAFLAPSVPNGGDIGTLSTVTTLARACVAEATWNADDCASVLHVLGRRAEAARVPIATMAQRYVSALRRGALARSWVLELEPSCMEPPRWPRSLLWRRWQPSCLATFERVASFLAGTLDDPTPSADHFGAPYGADLERAKRAGWQRVPCPGCANWYWRVGGARTLPAREAR